MSFENIDWPPLKLTDRQRELCNLLDREGGENYQLGNLYSGAIRVWPDPNNPDRIAQAANSLREIVEKLLLIVFGYVRKDRSEFNKMRGDIDDLLMEYKKTGDDGVKETLHDKLGEYLELSQDKHPPRAEQLGEAVATIYAGSNKLAEERGDQAKNLWDKLEICAHHGKCDYSFGEILEEFEKTVDLILANAVVINQKEIQKIVQPKDRSKQNRKRLFRLIGNNEANCRYFFELITEKADATWLTILKRRDYFKSPPEVEHSNDGWMTIPFWLPMPYLIKMVSCEPETVAKIVAKIPAVDSPRVCSQIMEIATLSPPHLSVELKAKIVEYTSKSSSIWGDEAAKLLIHWSEQNQTAAALELLQRLVEFSPDSKDKEKREQRMGYDSQHSETTQVSLFVKSSLKPTHRMDVHFYRELMNDVVPQLIEKDPYKVAEVLIKAVSNLMTLKFHDKEGNMSGLDIWYKSIRMRDETDEQYEGRKGHEEVLVDTMKLACEKVYERQPDKIVEIDKILRNEKWEFFKRLRTCLYAKHPMSAKTWIRELILEHEGYGKEPFGQDFWDMIKSACEHFGKALLTIEERTKIFTLINSASIRNDTSRGYTEDDPRRMQFYPFESVLFGKYKDIFQKLKNMPIKEEKVPPHYTPTEADRRSRHDLSPFSHDELDHWSDEELLNRINTWDSKDQFIKDDNIVSINKSGFAAMFYDVFKKSIAGDHKRMSFWQQKCDEIKHPIYVREMLHAMCDLVEAGQHGMLDEYLTISEKILIRSNEMRHSKKVKEWQRREPDWSSTRWPICELVNKYLKKKDEPIPSVWNRLVTVFTMLCKQYDDVLDGEQSQYHDQRNPANKGINCIRGRSLQALVDFALLAKKYNASSYISAAKKIIGQRLYLQTEHALKPEEYAILGVNYLRLHFLDKEWTQENRSKFFPQNNLPAWAAAFGASISYCESRKEIFEIVRENFAFAMQNLDKLRAKDNYGDAMLNAFELRLFNFYLAGSYPLVSDDSLLDQYYQKTASDKKGRGGLLHKVGDSLRDKDNQFSKEETEKILDFFRTRLAAEDFVKMDNFSPWLDIQQLSIKELLSACLKVLNTCEVDSFSTHVWLEKFCKMLPDHTVEVVECFEKLVCRENSNIAHINEERVSIIVTAGRNSGNEVTIRNANRAVNCLRRKSLISSLTLDD